MLFYKFVYSVHQYLYWKTSYENYNSFCGLFCLSVASKVNIIRLIVCFLPVMVRRRIQHSTDNQGGAAIPRQPVWSSGDTASCWETPGLCRGAHVKEWLCSPALRLWHLQEGQGHWPICSPRLEVESCGEEQDHCVMGVLSGYLSYVSVNRLHEWFSGPAHSTALSMVARVCYCW